MTDNGTFSVIEQRPLHYLVATVFALIDALFIYLLVGFALWPFLSPSLARLRGLRGLGITLLAMFTMGLFAILVAYIAALWTLESSLWGLSMPKTMLLLGNNGRYVTCLVIPIVLILGWDRPTAPKERPQRSLVVAAFCLLLPAMLFTSMVGQQLWSEDAGQQLKDVITEDETSIMLVAPEALSMHHLYVLKTSVDLDGTLGIDGYWRTAEDASAHLIAEGWKPDLVVVAPDVQLELNQEHWQLVGEENTPPTITGGLDESAWRIYRHIG